MLLQVTGHAILQGQSCTGLKTNAESGQVRAMNQDQKHLKTIEFYPMND
jgi:hypothetical protein